MQDPEDGAPFEPPATGPSPYEQVEAQQQQEMFDEALERVPPLFREVLVLRFQEQMKLEEIAKLIHIPLATVKTRIYRGVIALKPLLERRRAMTNHDHDRALELIMRRGVEDIAAARCRLAGMRTWQVARTVPLTPRTSTRPDICCAPWL